MKKPHTTDFTTRTIMALVVDQANLDEAHARNRVLIAALANTMASRWCRPMEVS